MTAGQIIQEIKQLPPGEREVVERFIREFSQSERLTGAELSSLADKLADAKEDNEVQALKEQITSGFYGDK